MINEKIWLSSPHMGGNEIKFVNDAFQTNWVAPLGPNVNGFENDLSSYIGIGHAAALSSGTAAIHLALILLGIDNGDEVICQSFTFSATANPIIYQHATPVFVDSEQDTWNMSPVLLETAIIDRIKNGKKPKAIIPVHLYGNPAKIDLILSIANKYDIPIVEDAAEALGSKLHNKKCGSFGIMNALSFNGNKIITTSGGGALVSDNKNMIDKARFLSTQARDNAPHYQHSQIGYNYRMSNVVAGIGRGQMEYLDNRVEARRANHNFYLDNFKNIDGITVLCERPGAFSNYWLTTILVDPQKTGGITREHIRLALEADNIESRPLWKPMHMQPVFANCPAYVDGTSENLFNLGLCLPSGSNLTSEQKQRVVNTIFKVIKK